ncbi:MAG TPA: DUF1579 family protein, partial [Longimicrobiales bacterium]|nr:DUF1579 family protein [Longimicrobiales bacterium]
AIAERATALTAEHEALGYFLGAWDVDIRLFMSGAPGEEPTTQVSRGTARGEWVVEDRWLGIALTGEMMGSPYAGYSIRGWDSYAKNWVTASVTSMDNALNVTRGVKVDPDGEVSAEYGVLDEYLTGELNKPYRTITRIHDDDRYTSEVWDMGIGTEGMKVLEFDFTRR